MNMPQIPSQLTGHLLLQSVPPLLVIPALPGSPQIDQLDCRCGQGDNNQLRSQTANPKTTRKQCKQNLKDKFSMNPRLPQRHIKLTIVYVLSVETSQEGTIGSIHPLTSGSLDKLLSHKMEVNFNLLSLQQHVLHVAGSYYFLSKLENMCEEIILFFFQTYAYVQCICMQKHQQSNIVGGGLEALKLISKTSHNAHYFPILICMCQSKRNLLYKTRKGSETYYIIVP